MSTDSASQLFRPIIDNVMLYITDGFSHKNQSTVNKHGQQRSNVAFSRDSYCLKDKGQQDIYSYHLPDGEQIDLLDARSTRIFENGFKLFTVLCCFGQPVLCDQIEFECALYSEANYANDLLHFQPILTVIIPILVVRMYSGPLKGRPLWFHQFCAWIFRGHKDFLKYYMTIWLEASLTNRNSAPTVYVLTGRQGCFCLQVV